MAPDDVSPEDDSGPNLPSDSFSELFQLPAPTEATQDKQDRFRVLIVDDERINLRMLATALGERYQVSVATDGSQALARVASDRPPDLILLDVVMPEMDGFQVCEKLKANPKTAHIPIIFLTARNSEADELRGLALGGVDFISKPVRPDIVRARAWTHLCLAREQSRLKEKLYQMAALSITDGLTGLANRRRFDDRLLEEWSRCLRSGKPLGLLMLDIDYFKNFNDHFGHADGDECLRKMAKALSSQARRRPDLVARYGGEEFAVILPETNVEGVRTVGINVLEAVRAQAIPHPRSAVATIVTVSLGGTSVIPVLSNEPPQLVRAADYFLYAAKHQGRNRLVVEEPTAALADRTVSNPEKPE